MHAVPLLGERRMRTAVVVEHEVQRHRVQVAFNLLAERIGEPGKAAHVHTHGR